MTPNNAPKSHLRGKQTFAFRALLGFSMLGICASQMTAYKAAASVGTEVATARACPGDIGTYANCLGGQDNNGAYFLVALPKVSNGILVVHAHGGPRHVPPAPNRADEDLVRFSAMVRAGYSWIGTTYRDGGYGVRLAAADVEQSRAIFWRQFGRPRRTILHGQSYGGNVVAKLAELDALDAQGQPKYDGMLLTSAAVGKRIETYNKLVNTRVVYQFFCRNLPLPNETQYPAWQGLPKQTDFTRAELQRRVNACTGADRAPADRTPEQARNLRAIIRATGEDAKELSKRLELTAFRFQDVVHNFLGGLNPFDNTNIVYRGSGQDAALNRGVERFRGTSKARDLLAYDSDLSGTIIIPTISLQAKFDPVVNYANERRSTQ
jgi:alpha-beta hydrolase superfamily lysophospholipase